MPAWSLTGECYPIDFTGIDIEYYAGRGVYQLTVTGVKPYTNMEVSLSHEAYNGRPAYWRTVVVGCVKNGLADAACLALLRDHEPRQIRWLTRHRDRGRLAKSSPRRPQVLRIAARILGRALPALLRMRVFMVRSGRRPHLEP